jgi:hypothetical protein
MDRIFDSFQKSLTVQRFSERSSLIWIGLSGRDALIGLRSIVSQESKDYRLPCHQIQPPSDDAVAKFEAHIKKAAFRHPVTAFRC